MQRMQSAHGAVLALLDTLSGTEVLAILILGLVLLGPERLPGVARQAGRWMNRLRDMSANLQNEVRDVLDDPQMQSLREVGEFVAQPRRKLAEYARSALEDDENGTGPSSNGSSGADAAAATSTDDDQPKPAVAPHPMSGVPDVEAEVTRHREQAAAEQGADEGERP